MAQRLQERGLLVVEAPEAPLLTQISAAQAPTPPLSDVFGDADSPVRPHLIFLHAFKYSPAHIKRSPCQRLDACRGCQ